jgi:hypothetical protein
MEFPHELRDLFADEIVEVRGNADALTVILKSDVKMKEFEKKLKLRFNNLQEPQTLFIRHENKQDFETVVLK